MNRMRNTLSLPLAAVALTALVLAGCSTAEQSKRDESGAITEANDKASVFDMKVGDCHNDPGDTAPEGDESVEMSTLPAVPCSDPHQYEVFATDKLTGDEFPGDAEVEKQAGDKCLAEFETFIGTPYDDSTLDFTYLYPSSQTWEMDDREITCLVVDPEKETTGSLKGAKR